MARTKPRLKMPPGSLSQSSFSRASRNRKLMRVATTTSLGETSRSSRSRFRRSPKFPVAMDRPCPAEPARPKGGRREVASAAADGGAHSRKVWAPLDGTIGGGAKRVKQSAGYYALRGFCYTPWLGWWGGTWERELDCITVSAALDASS